MDTSGHQVKLSSTSRRINSMEDLVALEELEAKNTRRKNGAFGRFLGMRLEKMSDTDSIDVEIHLAPREIPYLDKTRFSESEQTERTRQISLLTPPISVDSFAMKNGLAIGKKISKTVFTARMRKSSINKLRFASDLVQVSEFFEPADLQIPNPPFTSLTTSAYNTTALMPADARGQGINAATYEQGLTPDFANCLGNLSSNQIEFYPNPSSHSLETFKCLWQTASAANLFHVRGALIGEYDTYVPDHNLVSLSESRARPEDRVTCTNGNMPTIYPETAENTNSMYVDEWAYKRPYPVFSNPAANWGQQYETNWQCYNGISVGNVRHTNQSHFEMPVGENPQICEYSEGANQSRNPQNRYGGPIFKAANSVYTYASGDREMPYIVVPGYTPTTGIAMNDVCLPPNSAQARTPLWAGTSYSAPTANGIAACVLSANSRMTSWPEKVRAAMLVTAENVDGGYWNTNYGGADGLDGAGVVSGSSAVAFARGHSDVSAGHSNPVVDGMSGGSIGKTGWGSSLTYLALVPSPKPPGKHLRVVLTWDSNPVFYSWNSWDNKLSDLDLDVINAGTYTGSHSWNGNVEMVDLPASSLTVGATVTIKINQVIDRIPNTGFFYYSIAWTWVKDHAD